MPGGFTIEESARRLGHYRWAEIELFSVLGTWVADTPEVDVKLRFATSSRHHGWHSELLEERLPEVRELHPAAQTVPPNESFGAIVSSLRSITGEHRTRARLVGVYRVLVPHLLAAYRWHLERCTPVADSAVARTLGFVIADLEDDLAVAEGFLDVLDATSAGHAAAEALRDELEELLAVAGGISGPDTFVDTSDVSRRSSFGVDDVDVPG